VHVAYLRRHAHEDSNFDAAELIFGELITNVVRHAPGPISIRLEWYDDAPMMHVLDCGEGFDYTPTGTFTPPCEADLYRDGGRGLVITSHLANCVTIIRETSGSHVMASLPIWARADIPIISE
jgi:anti-sigma regulatory factor (Ser/Thr protein kinase)